MVSRIILILILECFIGNKMSIKQSIIQLTSLILIFTGCQKEKTADRDYPRLRTTSVDHITPEGARFNAMITSGSCESVSEYGFVWGSGEQPSVNGSEKIVVEESPAAELFSCDITFALEAMKDYFVRAYVRTGDLIIYGDAIKFKSLGSQAPVITDFEPKSATWGDTITIYGSNFSYQGFTNHVFFGELPAVVLSCSNEIIKVKVPDLNILHSEIAVEILGNRALAEVLFELVTPGKITAVDKMNIKWEDTLLIKGVFPTLTHNFNILIANIIANPIELSDSIIKVVVPNTIMYQDSIMISLSIDNHILKSPGKHHMAVPFITSVGSGEFGWGDTIEIKGFFNPVKNLNAVTFTSSASTILEVTREKILCIVPDEGINHTSTLKIVTGGYELQYANQLSLAGPIINSITPEKATVGEYMQIHGKYFRDGFTTITFGTKQAYLNHTGSRLIETDMPELSERGLVPITVRVYNKESTAYDMLYVLKPLILDFSPKEGTFGDTVTVTGEDFDSEEITFSFDGYIYSNLFLEKSPTMVKFSLPNSGLSQNNHIVIRIKEAFSVSTEILRIYPPKLDLVEPLSCYDGDTIKVNGDYFNPVANLNTLYIGGYQAEIINGNRTHLEFKFLTFPLGISSIQVGNGSSNTTYFENFQCTNP